MRPIANKWLLVILAFSLINSYQLLFAEDSIGPCYWQGTELMVLQDVQNGSLETFNADKGGQPAHWEIQQGNIITKSFNWQISGPSELISAGFGASQSGTHTCTYSLSSNVPPPPEIEGNPVNCHQAFIAYHGRPTEEYEKWRYYYMPDYEYEYIISSATYLDKAYVSQNYFMTGNIQGYKSSTLNYPCQADTYPKTNPFIYYSVSDWEEPKVNNNIEELGSLESYSVTFRDWDN